MSAERIPVRERVLELLPAIAALLLHAIALDRWISAIPALLAIGVVVARRAVLDSSTGWMLLCGFVGALVGGVEFLVEPPPPGPLPPIVLSLVSGALVGFVVYTSTARRLLHGQVYPWLLVALSLSVPGSPVVRAAFAAMAAATLVSSFATARLGRSGVFGYAFFLGFFALLTTGSLGVAMAARAGSDWLTDAVYRWSRDLGLPNGIAFESMLHLKPRQSVERSLKPLLEVSGQADRLRTGVLDDFDGWTWKTSDALGLRRVRPVAAEAPRTIELVPLENLSPTLPAPAGTWQVDGSDAEPFAAGLWKASGTLGRTLTLHLGHAEAHPRELPPDARMLQIPEPLQQTLEPLTRAIVGETHDARTQAMRLERHFTSHFRYSLDTDLRGDGHPLEVLLRERRPAYCAYFASAMAAMLRSVGTPARVVTGFLVSEVNPYTGRALVRARDAHAWVETYVPAEGRWVAFDPTPALSREELLGLDDKPSTLRLLLEAAISSLRRTLAEFRADPMTWIFDRVTSPWVVLPLVLLVVWILWRRGVFRLRRGGEARTVRIEVGESYRLYLKALRKGAGLEPGASETDEELVARLRALRGAPAADAAEAFLSAYRAQRYRSGAADARALGEQLRALELALG